MNVCLNDNGEQTEEKPLTIERCQYVVSQLSKYGLNWINADSGIFSGEFRYVLENNSKKSIAEYYLEGSAPLHCMYWHENMDDRGGGMPYELAFEIESVLRDVASVSLTKKWLEPEEEWHFRMIMKYELGEWRLHEFISIGRGHGEKQDAIDYLAAVPFSTKWSRWQNIDQIYEYYIYLDGKECGLRDIDDLLGNNDFVHEDFYPYNPYGSMFSSSYRCKLKEPIVSVIVFTHRETGERKVLMCTCKH